MLWLTERNKPAGRSRLAVSAHEARGALHDRYGFGVNSRAPRPPLSARVRPLELSLAYVQTSAARSRTCSRRRARAASPRAALHSKRCSMEYV